MWPRTWQVGGGNGRSPFPNEAGPRKRPTEFVKSYPPGTLCLDRVLKVPGYAEFGVNSLWLIDPKRRSLGIFRLEESRRLLLGSYTDSDKVCADPFRQIEVDPRELWAD